jgi:hypothetical protein
MKKIAILLIGLCMISCSNEELGNSEIKSKLISIEENQYLDNELWIHKVYNFDNNKLINIKYENSDFGDEYTYNEKGLDSKVVENVDIGKVLKTTTYSYDDKGRLIEYNQIPGNVDLNLSTFKYTFTYLSDRILRTFKSQSGYSETIEFFVDANYNIIKKTIANSDYSYIFTYENGNLTEASEFNKNNKGTSVNYKYSNLKNELQINQFIFGKEWKLNSFLYRLHPNNYILTGISENLISEYSTTFRNPINPDNQTDITKFTYNMNDKNQMEKQTILRTATTNGIVDVNSRTEISYKYE